MSVPRLRMFAGPNGSGKSTIKAVVAEKYLGFYINPDELEVEIKRTRHLDLRSRGIEAASETILDFLQKSILVRRDFSEDQVQTIRLIDGVIDLSSVPVGPYLASVASDLLRVELLKTRASFTFETVMSHPDKVEFLRSAQQEGYRTYLYYIATEDPEINVSRVKNRVGLGGHDVPDNKIRARYHRSLNLLPEAISSTNRAFVFDNSGSFGEHFLIAEITNGTDIEIRSDDVPVWFQKSVLDKIS